MKSLVKTASGINFQEVPEPILKSDDQVKIKIKRAALCRTDLYVADGSIPVETGRILGHEAAGEVIQCGSSVSGLNPGDRVVIDPLKTCGELVVQVRRFVGIFMAIVASK